jgi:hypothetical protein
MASNRFIGNKNDFVLPQCHDCAHYYTGGMTCDAFIDGIPVEIFTNEHDHRKPYPGDNGIRFEPIKGDNG